jgi:hypothetical protein
MSAKPKREESNAKNMPASTTEKKIEGAGAPNPFDLDALRLPPSFEQAAGVKSVIDTVLVRKPHQQEWFHVHPDPAYRGNFGLIKLKAERDESYVVVPQLLGILDNELVRATIYTCMNRNNKEIFLWPVNLVDGSQGRRIEAIYSSAHECAAAAMERPIRMKWVGGYYQRSVTESPVTAPEWPDVPFSKLMELAFRKTGSLVDSLDHPVIKMLRGQQ